MTAAERAAVEWHPTVRNLPAHLRVAYLALLFVRERGAVDLESAANVFQHLATEPSHALPQLARRGLVMDDVAGEGVLVLTPQELGAMEVFT